jgi:pyrrolidone-carboxylate peptidase
MLPGFEDITNSLTEYELTELVPDFVSSFKKRQGKEMAITNKEIVSKMKIAGEKYMSDVKVRKIINHIRTHALVPGLVASSSGYYVTNDPQEVQRYINSLDGREAEIRRVKQTFKQYLNQLHNPQTLFQC